MFLHTALRVLSRELRTQHHDGVSHSDTLFVFAFLVSFVGTIYVQYCDQRRNEFFPQTENITFTTSSIGSRAEVVEREESIPPFTECWSKEIASSSNQQAYSEFAPMPINDIVALLDKNDQMKLQVP